MLTCILGNAQSVATNGDRTFNGSVDASNAISFKPRQGAILPATCAVGETFLLTSGTPFIEEACVATNTWVSVGTSSAGSVSSAFGRVGAVVAASGDYTSDQVTPGTTNKYYSDALARAAFSALTPILYNSTTGVLSCQTVTSLVSGCLAATDFATFAAKQSAIITGTTAQYLRGDLSLATFPASLTPTAHAATHASAGSDPVTLSESQVTGLVSDLAGKQASLGYTPLNAALNLSDIASAPTARTSLGLGTAATQATGAFDAAGAAATAQAAATALSAQRASNLSDLV